MVKKIQINAVQIETGFEGHGKSNNFMTLGLILIAIHKHILKAFHWPA